MQVMACKWVTMVRVYTVFSFFVFKFANEKRIPFSFFVFKFANEKIKTNSFFVFRFHKWSKQSCQVELSVMREISLLQYVKRGRNICKTRSALPEVAKQPRMLGESGGMPPGICFVIENAKYVISCLFRLHLIPMTLRKWTIYFIF